VSESSIAIEKVVALEQATARGDLGAVVAAADDAVRGGPPGSTETALRRAIERFPKEARLGVLLLDLQRRTKDWAGLDATLPGLLARFSSRSEVHFGAGKALEARGLACAAIRAYGRAARLDPDDIDPVACIARVFRSRGRPFLARRRLRRAIVRHPDAAPLHAAMGYSYVEDGQTKKAVAAFHRAVALEPDESPYLEELGVALLVDERWREAAATAVRTLRARPEREKAWTVYAVAHRHLGNAEQAEKGYRNALKFARDPGRARGNLGLFLASRDDVPAEARGHLQAALDAHPDWEAVRKAIDRLPPGT
jgi:Tfp pilus assembly protein PilF